MSYVAVRLSFNGSDTQFAAIVPWIAQFRLLAQFPDGELLFKSEIAIGYKQQLGFLAR